jgi:hypothetical protein
MGCAVYSMQEPSLIPRGQDHEDARHDENTAVDLPDLRRAALSAAASAMGNDDTTTPTCPKGQVYDNKTQNVCPKKAA